MNQSVPSAYQAPSPPLNEVPLLMVVVHVMRPLVTTAASSTPVDRLPQVAGRKRRSLSLPASSVR